MWPFVKRSSLKESGFFHHFTECHCHLLPGVDDGAQTMEDSLSILARYESLGIKEVWITPHIMEDVPNTSIGLKKRLAELKCSYSGKITLHLAAEYMMDNLFDERLKQNDLLPIGKDGNSLLVETSYFNPPMGLHHILENIRSRGYYPMLAHPERYQYMDEKEYDSLKGMGVRFQLNLPSLVGMYGDGPRKKAELLLKKGYYNFVGGDTHREHPFLFLVDAKLKVSIINQVKELASNF